MIEDIYEDNGEQQLHDALVAMNKILDEIAADRENNRKEINNHDRDSC